MPPFIKVFGDAWRNGSPSPDVIGDGGFGRLEQGAVEESRHAPATSDTLAPVDKAEFPARQCKVNVTEGFGRLFPGRCGGVLGAVQRGVQIG